LRYSGEAGSFGVTYSAAAGASAVLTDAVPIESAAVGCYEGSGYESTLVGFAFQWQGQLRRDAAGSNHPHRYGAL